MWVIRYFICASNIVETPFTPDVGNNTQNAFDTRCTTLLMVFVDTTSVSPIIKNFLDPRMDIRYRGGRETISLLKTFYSAAKI